MNNLGRLNCGNQLVLTPAVLFGCHIHLPLTSVVSSVLLRAVQYNSMMHVAIAKTISSHLGHQPRFLIRLGLLKTQFLQLMLYCHYGYQSALEAKYGEYISTCFSRALSTIAYLS